MGLVLVDKGSWFEFGSEGNRITKAKPRRFRMATFGLCRLRPAKKLSTAANHARLSSASVEGRWAE
jgi:hypothetical protein